MHPPSEFGEHRHDVVRVRLVQVHARFESLEGRNYAICTAEHAGGTLAWLAVPQVFEAEGLERYAGQGILKRCSTIPREHGYDPNDGQNLSVRQCRTTAMG